MIATGTHSIADCAALHPEQPAVVFPETGATLTYATLDRRAAEAAAWFVALGLQPGQTIAILLDTCAAIFELAVAAERAGLYYTPIGTHLHQDEIEYLLQDSAARLLVTHPQYLPRLPAIRGLLVATVRDAPRHPRQTIDYDEALAAAPTNVCEDLQNRPIGRDLMYSSGTTGHPKGIYRALRPAALRNRPLPYSAVLQAADIGSPDTVYLSTGPLYHAAPHRFSLHVLRCGGTVIAPRRFDAATALDLIERYRVTHSQWVPTMFVRLLALPPETRAAYDLSSHRRAIHAAAPCAPAVKHAMIDWWGPILFEYYAGTETIGATGIESEDWRAHPGSVGRAFAGIIHIAAEDGTELAQGDTGTIWFEGLPPFEYLNDPAKTAAARHREGWLTYGDLGHVDPNGYLYLSDRRTDLIITGGVNVYPQEVEAVLTQHPEVAEACVVGIPDPEMGERVHAAIVLRPTPPNGTAVDSAALIAFCRDHLSPVKTPRTIDIVESLPRSDVGKLLRRQIKLKYSTNP